MFIGCDQIADSVASKVTIKMIEPITAAMKEIKTDAFKSAHVQ